MRAWGGAVAVWLFFATAVVNGQSSPTPTEPPPTPTATATAEIGDVVNAVHETNMVLVMLFGAVITLVVWRRVV